jgi:cysteine desulfurase
MNPNASSLAREKMKEEAERLSLLRNRFLDGILAIPGTSLNGDPAHLLPNTCNISFEGMASQVLIAKLNKHMAVSSGSACTSATLEPSYVLVAMGLGDERAGQSLRFSLGKYTTSKEVRECLNEIEKLF